MRIKNIFRYQKIRFLGVGIFNTGVDFVVFNLILIVSGINPIIANTISILVSMSVSYFLNHYVVFNSKKPITVKAIIVFMLTTGTVLLVAQNSALAFVLYSFDHIASSSTRLISENKEIIEANVAKLIAVLISMVANFLVYKYVIFKDKNNDHSDGIEKK